MKNKNSNTIPSLVPTKRIDITVISRKNKSQAVRNSVPLDPLRNIPQFSQLAKSRSRHLVRIHSISLYVSSVLVREQFCPRKYNWLISCIKKLQKYRQIESHLSIETPWATEGGINRIQTVCSPNYDNL